MYVGCFNSMLVTKDLRKINENVSSMEFNGGGVWRIKKKNNLMAVALGSAEKYCLY